MLRQRSSLASSFAFGIFACAAFFSSTSPANAQTEAVIHGFRVNSTTDGLFPASNLISDSHGALYGTTAQGGKLGAGTVYKLAPPATQSGPWRQNILYSFTGGTDGAFPSGNLILDHKTGKLYGIAGGLSDYDTAVFELSPPTQPGNPWTETVIYSFTSTFPYSGISSLVSDGKGRLYGTTETGGRYQSGSVFVLYSTNGFWNERDIYSFQTNGSQLAYPGGLVLGSAGVLYGLTSYGGTVFSLTPPAGGKGAWTQSVIHMFGGGSDGIQPLGTLVLDGAGSLYGVTILGGQFSNGIAFQLTPPPTQGGAWTESVLYSFQGGSDGSYPVAGVTLDSTGALYGVTEFGGDASCSDDGSLGCGTVFKLSPPSTQGGAWTEAILHDFTWGSDGTSPQAPVIVLGTTVYGTTLWGGAAYCTIAGTQVGCGTVFQITQ